MYKQPYVLELSETYGVFELSGKVSGEGIYKEELNSRNGLTCRSCTFNLMITDGTIVTLKLSAYSDKVGLYKKVPVFYDSLTESMMLKCSGSIRYVRDNTIELAVYRHSTEDWQCNKFFQPIVFNKMEGTGLNAYIMQGTGKKHHVYVYETEFPKVPRLQRGDAIIAEGKIGKRLTLTGFVPKTWEKQKYDESLFKDDEVRSLFNGTDPDLAKLL
jgi:hypothetical protein